MASIDAPTEYEPPFLVQLFVLFLVWTCGALGIGWALLVMKGHGGIVALFAAGLFGLLGYAVHASVLLRRRSKQQNDVKSKGPKLKANE